MPAELTLESVFDAITALKAEVAGLASNVRSAEDRIARLESATYTPRTTSCDWPSPGVSPLHSRRSSHAEVSPSEPGQGDGAKECPEDPPEVPNVDVVFPQSTPTDLPKDVKTAIEQEIPPATEPCQDDESKENHKKPGPVVIFESALNDLRKDFKAVRERKTQSSTGNKHHSTEELCDIQTHLQPVIQGIASLALQLEKLEGHLSPPTTAIAPPEKQDLSSPVPGTAIPTVFQGQERPTTTTPEIEQLIQKLSPSSKDAVKAPTHRLLSNPLPGKTPHLQSNLGRPVSELPASQPVFGQPSTPATRTLPASHISDSPFAKYGDKTSPFAQLGKPSASPGIQNDGNKPWASRLSVIGGNIPSDSQASRAGNKVPSDGQSSLTSNPVPPADQTGLPTLFISNRPSSGQASLFGSSVPSDRHQSPFGNNVSSGSQPSPFSVFGNKNSSSNVPLGRQSSLWSTTTVSDRGATFASTTASSNMPSGGQSSLFDSKTSSSNIPGFNFFSTKPPSSNVPSSSTLFSTRPPSSNVTSGSTFGTKPPSSNVPSSSTLFST